ncbi:MAG: polyprenyl synthetase family protein [Tannerellaceae bacterium]|nr:polyprenyl synthetase family protein [Tannerellaceae bacterium]
MDVRKIIEEPIAEELIRFKKEFADSLRSDTFRLQEAIDKILAYSGKHIRPLLVLLVAKSTGGITQQTFDSAIMLELLHTSSLVHDDVIDETKVRRGQPSLNAIFDNRVSVLVGDYILSSALIRSTMTNNMDIIRIVSDVGRHLAEGEIQQMQTADETILDEACYMEVIRKKTAVLLSACTEIGAISAGACDEWVQAARLFGEYIGICFQIKDDIFDYYPNANIGKPTGNDIREGKVTLPLLYALRQEEQEGGATYLELVRRKEFTPEHVETLIEFAKVKGGVEYAEKVMKEYRLKAIEVLETFPPSPSRDSLLLLTDYIIDRKK